MPDTALPDTLLLDLDGTLVDSAPGILGSLRAAFDEVGVPWPEGRIDRTILGPPMYVSLPPIIGDAAPAVVAAYRRIYADGGLLQSTPFEGVDELLRDLAAAGVRMAVATSKAEPFAREIVERRGWADLFATVCGDTLAGERPTKADVVGEALRRLGGPGAAVMVGDRSHDVRGARANGLDCLGVAWGYAAPGELDEAGAVAVYGSPAELADALGC